MQYLTGYLMQLELHGSISATEIAAVTCLTRLTSLALSNWSEQLIQQADLDMLSSLKSLKSLELRTGWARGEGTASTLACPVTSLSSLQCLSLTSLSLNDSRDLLINWSSFPALKCLDLCKTDPLCIPDSLSGLCALQKLSLTYVRLTGSSSGLAILSNLTKLKLQGVATVEDCEAECKLSLVLPRVISTLTGLHRLHVNDSPMSVESCALHRMTALTMLDLSCQQLGASEGDIYIYSGSPSASEDDSEANSQDGSQDGSQAGSQGCSEDVAFSGVHGGILPPNLVELDLNRNILRSLPADLTCLTRLQVLDLSFQTVTHKVWEREGMTSHLMGLDESLAGIVCMPQMREVNLQQFTAHWWSHEDQYHLAAASQAIYSGRCNCEVNFDKHADPITRYNRY